MSAGRSSTTNSSEAGHCLKSDSGGPDSAPQPRFHGEIVAAERILEPCTSRAAYLATLLSSPHSSVAWHNYLKVASESAPARARAPLLRLYVRASRVIPPTAANRHDPVYLSLWLELARMQSTPGDDDALADARATLKYMKLRRIGTDNPALYLAWASVEERAANFSKASKLRKEASACRPLLPAGSNASPSMSDVRLNHTPASRGEPLSVSRRPNAIESSASRRVLTPPRRALTPLVENLAFERPPPPDSDAKPHAASPPVSPEGRMRDATPTPTPQHLSSKRPPRLPVFSSAVPMEDIDAQPSPDLHPMDKLASGVESRDALSALASPKIDSPLAASTGGSRMQIDCFSQQRVAVPSQAPRAKVTPRGSQFVNGFDVRGAGTPDPQRSENAPPARGSCSISSEVPQVSQRALNVGASPAIMAQESLPRRQEPSVLAPIAQPLIGSHTDGQQSSQENVLTVNRKYYKVLACVGKGGSSKVYKVEGVDGSVYALKRVKVPVSSRAAFDSYANEIDLLRSLQGRQSIVQLVDAEVRRAQGVIHLLMEFGDVDLAKLLNRHAKEKSLTADGRRQYWKQMLVAVGTIHGMKIVHSDLKPANFLLVQGNLKLIDFGIAKAIQTDDTTKIERDCQIGTPNYMSPEALMAEDGDGDSTNSDGVDAGSMNSLDDERAGHRPRPKRYRVGRASDIWSLGCILYQMVYGRTPFAHIRNTGHKLNCIQDPEYEIQYPSPDRVDKHALSVIKGCLQRDPGKRMKMSALMSHQYLHSGQVTSCIPRAPLSSQRATLLLEAMRHEGLPEREIQFVKELKDRLDGVLADPHAADENLPRVSGMPNGNVSSFVKMTPTSSVLTGQEHGALSGRGVGHMDNVRIG